MGLLYDLFMYSFTAVVLSFLVSKLISLAVSTSDVSGGKEPCGGGGVGEGNLEKKLEVGGSKSLKKRRKKTSGETVLVSEFKGKIESAIGDESLVGLVKADDDRKEFASLESESLETDVSEACSADRLLSAGEVGGMKSSVIPADVPAENEGLISLSKITLNEVGHPAEGSEQEINSGSDLEKLVVSDRRTDYKEDDVVGEESGRFDFNPREEAVTVGHGDQELVNVVLPSETSVVTEKPKYDDVNDVELLSGRNAVDDQYEHHMILESLEDDDLIEELSSAVSKNDMFNIDQETERIDVGLLGCENAVDHQHKHHEMSDSLESAVEDSSQGGYVDDLNDARRNEERSIENEGIVEMEISDGEEWEGIERNELERDFAKAMNYVECGNKDGQLSTLGSDVIMQFYGLQKVSMEGPCHESPPMPLKLSARAKWNAWQKLGSMIPEEAMEKYINLLSEKVPGWMGDRSVEANISTTLTVPLTNIDESKNGEDSSSVNKDEE